MCQAGGGSHVCTSFTQKLSGYSCRRSEIVHEMLGKEAGKGKAEEGDREEEQLRKNREEEGDI